MAALDVIDVRRGTEDVPMTFVTAGKKVSGVRCQVSEKDRISRLGMGL